MSSEMATLSLTGGITESPSSFDVDVNFPKTNFFFSKIKAQCKAIAEVKAEAEKVTSVKGQEYLSSSLSAFVSFWAKTLDEISSLAKEGELSEAINVLDEAAKKKIDLSEAQNLLAEKEAMLIASWLRCRLESLLFKKQKKEGVAWDENEISGHYYRCLALPLGLESEEKKEKLVDEARGFLYCFHASSCLASPQNYKTYLSALPHWKMSLREKALSEETEAYRKALFESFIHCFNVQSEIAFSKDHDYERSLEFFRFRGLLQKEDILYPPYRFAYDENEFKLYFYEALALGKSEEEFPLFAKEIVNKIRSVDDFEFSVVGHFLSLNGLSSLRFKAMLNAVKPLSFEMKIQLLASSISLGMVPARVSMLLKSIERTVYKKLDLEALGKPLLFIKNHLNDALLLRFLPLLDAILRSPHAHKVIVKSDSNALHALAGENDKAPRMPLGKALKNTTVASWGKMRLFAYLSLGVALPIVVLFFLFIFILNAPGISTNLCSWCELSVMVAMLVFALLTLNIWVGFDERGSAVMRTVLLADALWKAAMSAAYFMLPSTLIGLDRIRYGLFTFALIEAFASFILLKPVKKKALRDYVLFALVFALSVLGLIYMVLDMMRGLI